MPQCPSFVPQEKDSIPLRVVKNPGDGSSITRKDSGPYEPSPPSNPISRRPTGGPLPKPADSTYYYQGYTNPGVGTIIDSDPNWPHPDPNTTTIHDPDFSKYYTAADNSRFQPPITEFSDEYNSFTDSFPPANPQTQIPISFPRQPNPNHYHRTVSANDPEPIDSIFLLT